MLLTAPFVWNEHEIPYDFFRFTQYAHKDIFKKVGFFIRTIEPTTSFFATIGQLMSAFLVEILADRSLILRILISILFSFPIQVIFLILDFILKSKWLTLDYFVVAEKSKL